MAKVVFFGKIAALTLFMASLMLSPNVALGVTAADYVKDVDGVSQLTSGAAARAQADVQIRRIKNLIVTKRSSVDTDFDRLKKLQRTLRGQK